jgi:BirA family transcriptional regulator, biotin operon repressor / biotin---[acetyl-CoA-carboxylase] ligase
MKFTVLNFDSIESTNTEALNQARQGADEGLCILARRQTAGRGRLGRTWISERDAGLYFSIVLRPVIETTFLPLITLMAGAAVHATLAEFGIEADIKWVNDVHVNEKKVCGILSETAETPRGLAVIVGIGINIGSSNFPSELVETVTSIENEISGQPPTPQALSELLTGQLAHFYAVLSGENGPQNIRREWKERSTYYSGKQVRVALDHETFSGVTDGLEDNGALRVSLPDGSIRIVQAGDIQRLRSE